MSHRIERLGQRGDGVVAGPIFVPMTLPGEVVEGEVEGDRIAAPRILTPSPDRVRAPCGHFKTCGGCALQHARDEFVEGWKADGVRAALAARGLEAPIRTVHTSPPASRRRATLHGRRTKGGAMVGFHSRRSDTLVDTPNCILLTPGLMAALPALRELTLLGATRKSEISLTVCETVGGVDVVVRGARELDRELETRLPAVAAAHDLARLTWNGETLVTREPPAVRFGVAQVVPPPGAFLQATEAGQTALTNAVKEAIGPARRVADLFAGCGTFSLPLAEQAEVFAVEGAAPMLEALDHGWRHAGGLRAIRTEARDLFRRPLMPDELKGFDALVIDPPRAGAKAQMEEVAASDIPLVASVSCDPTSFARDAAILIEGGFTLDWIDVVDQFRWSTHTELAARFSRGHIAG